MWVTDEYNKLSLPALISGATLATGLCELSFSLQQWLCTNDFSFACVHATLLSVFKGTCYHVYVSLAFHAVFCALPDPTSLRRPRWCILSVFLCKTSNPAATQTLHNYNSNNRCLLRGYQQDMCLPPCHLALHLALPLLHGDRHSDSLLFCRYKGYTLWTWTQRASSSTVGLPLRATWRKVGI